MFYNIKEILLSNVELDLWKIKYNNFPVWSVFRNYYFIDFWIKDKTTFLKKNHNNSLTAKIVTKIKNLLNQFFDLRIGFFYTIKILFKKQSFSDIFIINTANIIEMEGFAIQDRLYHRFIIDSKNPLIIQKPYPKNNKYNGVKIANYSVLVFFSKIIYLFCRLTKLEKKKIANLYLKIKELLILKRKYNFLSLSQMFTKYKNDKRIGGIFKIIFSKNSSSLKFIYCDDASYQIDISHIIFYSKQKGIKSIELQHGIIKNFHPPYYYHKSYFTFIKFVLPDYLFTYGKYWHKHIKSPVKTIILGHSILKNYDMHKLSKTNTILIISQPFFTSKIISIAKYIAKKFPEYNISYKTHPRDTKKDLDILKNKYKNLILIQSPKTNPYKLLNDNYIIVGYYSTLLYEAKYFLNKKILYLDNDIFPKEFGISFTDYECLETKINEINESDIEKIEKNFQLFSSNYEQNYKNIKKLISINKKNNYGI